MKDSTVYIPRHGVGEEAAVARDLTDWQRARKVLDSVESGGGNGASWAWVLRQHLVAARSRQETARLAS